MASNEVEGKLSAEVGGNDASGTASTSVGANHINQVDVPRQDGPFWIALSSLIGSVLTLFVDSGSIDNAKEAEDTWEDLTDQIRKRGQQEFIQHADKLKDCDDKLWRKLCDFALCGYKPDYQGILNRARADAAKAAQKEITELSRYADRFNSGINADLFARVRRAELQGVIGITAQLREEERKNAFSMNWNLLSKAAEAVENTRMNRIELGGQLMSGAGANYASLAESYRQTAEKNKGGFNTLFGLVGALIPTIISQWDNLYGGEC